MSLSLHRRSTFAVALFVPLAVTAAYVHAEGSGTVPKPSDLLYVPIEPCKIIDLTSSTKLSAANARTFVITGNAGFAAQGGAAAGCGIPAAARAVTLTLQLKTATSKGYITGARSGHAFHPEPLLMFQSSSPIVNSAFVRVGTDGRIKLKSNGASSEIAAYVSGYYIEQMHALIDTGDSTHAASIISGSQRALNATNIGTGLAEVTFDTDVTNCTPVATPYNSLGYGASALVVTGHDGKVRVGRWYVGTAGDTPIYSRGKVYVGVKC